MLGVLGGMGPLATVDFMQKIIALTQASKDQEHLPMLVHNVPQIPDRSACILEGCEDPFPALLRGLRSLERGGAQCAVIPCNTAHFWFDKLHKQARIPMISILSCVEQHIRRNNLRKIGVMATSATVSAIMYQRQIENDGRECLIPEQGMQTLMMDAIYDIKAGRLEQGSQCMKMVFDDLVSQGAEAVILGCTEIPVGLADVVKTNPGQYIDATALLAGACVDWYSQQEEKEAA
ncbi:MULTISPECIES: aspartate/glutamate racemase family protein [unclassified Endozoicomonas]|uniref:aspartate/glutamate racemase family protein n=1 Tax=unclassified Endozoicomonas TaxID=2644528 RepID=UPI003BB609FC